MKLPGRVGDTPLIGCGTYADDGLAAVSCTGHGERIIQLTLARHAADLVGRGARRWTPPARRSRARPPRAGERAASSSSARAARPGSRTTPR